MELPMNSDSELGSEGTDTTSCMCGARPGLIGTFADRMDLSSAGELASEPRGGMKDEHGVECFVCQGAHGDNVSLYEIDVVLEEYGRIKVFWLCGGKRCRRWVDEGRHWG